MSELIGVPPGSYRHALERRGRFDELFAAHGAAFWIADERVCRLHPHVARSLRKVPGVMLRAGESAKSLKTLERLGRAAVHVPRNATILAIGGGSIGDVATVFAHLHKRGARLVHVPTTWLAAVDSSVGGKGAVNVAGVKNALGVFHSAEECWLCDELFTTLTAAQRVEGEAEAWKMALSLDEVTWRTWRLAGPDDRSLVATARALKVRLCDEDPWEQTGRRAVLNFGHTFAHVVESVTHYRVRHGVAVALGLRCALDVGVAVGVTPRALALDADARLPFAERARPLLARSLGQTNVGEVQRLLRSDKKGADSASAKWVLLEAPGRTVLESVPHSVWKGLFRTWTR